MTKSIKNNLLLLTLSLVFGLSSAQGNGPGGWEPLPKNPIDMYVYVLMAVAVVFIALVGKKLIKTKA